MDDRQKASRARALLSDDLLREVLDGLRAEQVQTFQSRGASPESVIEARHMVWALRAIEDRLQSVIDAGALAEARQKKAGPR